MEPVPARDDRPVLHPFDAELYMELVLSPTADVWSRRWTDPRSVGVYAWAMRLIEDHQLCYAATIRACTGHGVLRSFAGRFYWRPPLDQPMAMVVPDAYVRHVVGRAGPLHWRYADIKDVVAMAHDIVLCTQAPAIVAAEKSP